MWKRKLYQWHRKLAIVALVPVLMWTASGILHPIMSNFKPEMAKKFLPPTAFDQTKLKLPLDSALALNGIEEIQNFRFVTFQGHSYYQIQQPNQQRLVYLDVENGQQLDNGDELYAEYLARAFSGDKESSLKSITLQQAFTTEYARIFRLLPAYRVAFDRPDGLRFFVETKSSRLGTAVNDSRAAFSWLFAQMHNWGFLNFNENIRITVILILVIVTLFTSFTGILVYSVLWKNLKKSNTSTTGLRKYHRSLGIVVSFALLLFGISAAFHIIPKYRPDNRASFNNDQVYKLSELEFSLKALLKNAELKGTIANTSLIRLAGQIYLQFQIIEKQGVQRYYYNVEHGEWLVNGDQAYARFLANRFSGYTNNQITSVELISKFSGEYGFVNKRLPVYKVQYQIAGNPRFYVETSTGLLGAKVEDKLAMSGFMFGYFHKYRFLDFGGKGFRDVVMSLFAFGNFVTALMGLALFLKKYKKKPKSKEELAKQKLLRV